MKKKIFTLLMLALCSVGSVWADDVYQYRFTGGSAAEYKNGTKQADSFFSHGTDKWSFNSKFNNGQYDGVTYTNGLKMEAATSISFTTDNTSTVIIVQSDWESSSVEHGTPKTIKFDGSELAVSDAANGTNCKIYTISDVAKGDHSITRGSGESGLFLIQVTVKSKAISSQALTGVKVNGTAIEASKYTVSGEVLELTDSYAMMPTIALVNTVTYDDATYENIDVNVTLAKNGDYFEGTATIGETTYTVKVPVSVAATLAVSSETAEIVSAGALGSSKTITLTGANLTGDATVAWATDVEGLTVSPTTFTIEAGAVNKEFTINYVSNKDVAESTVNLTFTVGETSVSVPVTYSSTAAIELSSISTAKTWDFSKLTANDVGEGRYGDNGVKLSNETSPSLSDDVTYENYNGHDITVASGFDATTLAFAGQYPARNNVCQNGTLHFKTTVPGTITVNFSDTGSSPNASAVKRYLNVNGSNTSYWTSRPTSGSTKSNDQKTTDAIEVPAGDVYITGMQEDGTTSTAICIYTLTFTPATETATITAAKYATYVPTMKVAVPEGVTAYIVSTATGTEATLSPVTVIPANEPVVLYKDVDADTEVTFTATADASSVSGNQLKYSDDPVTADGSQYVLAQPAGKEVGFYKATTGTIAARKAYLFSPSDAPYFTFGFGDTTAISDQVAVDSDRRADAPVYNLAGQRVSQPTRGLYIVGGKKVVIK